jgi:serine phosphatase RsbU (regulator of sigma subunit)
MTVQGQVIRHSVARCSLGYIEAIAEADKPKVATISYSTGDLFVIVTDGFTDQIGGQGDKKIAYGYRRLETLLQKNKDADAQTMAECMREDFKRWQGAEVRRDDVTAVVFRL